MAQRISVMWTMTTNASYGVVQLVGLAESLRLRQSNACADRAALAFEMGLLDLAEWHAEVADLLAAPIAEVRNG